MPDSFKLQYPWAKVGDVSFEETLDPGICFHRGRARGTTLDISGFAEGLLEIVVSSDEVRTFTDQGERC